MLQGQLPGLFVANTGSEPVTVVWADDPAVDVTVGGAAGSLQRAVNEVLPRYRGQLVAVAERLRTQVDEVHTTAFDQTGAPGAAFFSLSDDGVLAVEITDPAAVAASESVPTIA